MADKKKFGLVMPKKVETFKMQTRSIFNDDSDEEEKNNKRPKIPQKKMDSKSKLKPEFMEDPSMYEYDSIYDEMKAKQTESITPKEKKNSRYIETLLKAADNRKKEYERRVDKKIQAEREKEGDKYNDKEEFVSSSYKKKLQEKEEEEERERRKNMLNDMMDVTKQKDLSGFYRHFLNQSVGEEKVPVFGAKQIKKEVDSDHDETVNRLDEKVNNEKNIDEDSDGIEIDSDSESESSDVKSNVERKNEIVFRKKFSKNANQRHKDIKENSDSDEQETARSQNSSKTCIRKSIESSDSDTKSSGDEVNKAHNKGFGSVNHEQKHRSKRTKKHNSRHDSSSSDEEHHKKSDNYDTASVSSKKERHSKINVPPKHTIGDVFTEAQARYFQRMTARE